MSRATLLRTTLAVVLSASMASAYAPPVRAQASKTDEARSRFQRGVELFRDNDFRAALIEFKRAYELAPNYKVLYNLGQTSLELQDYASALKAFEQYLREGGKDVPAKRKTEVEAELLKLRTRVAKVTVDVNVEGAEISVDDVVVGRSPLSEPVTVSAGRRKISVTKTGMTSATRMIDIAGGDVQKVPLELVDPQAANTARPPPPVTPESDTPTTTPVTVVPPPPVKTKNMTPVWIGLGVTGVLAVGAGVFGVLALDAKSSFDDRVSTLGTSTQSIDDARTRTRTLALVTDIVGASAIVAGGITLVLALTRPTVVKEAAFVRPYFAPLGAGLAGSF